MTCERCGDNNKGLGNIQGSKPEYICGPYCFRWIYCDSSLRNLLKSNGGEYTTPCGLKVKVTVERSKAE